MHKVFGGFIALSVAVVTTACFAKGPAASEVEAKFSKLLRNTKVSSVKESDVKGLYEVIAGPNVFYYSPEGEGHLIFGQIVDKDGKNLTAVVQQNLREEFQKEQEKRAAEMLKTLPLDKAVKIGSGPNTVIEFTDPDCPYCRKVDEFLSKRTDVTRHVYLFPLESIHPNSRAKAVFILNSKDKAKAFREVFEGKYDRQLPIASTEMGRYPTENSQLNAGMELGQKLGVQGTPMLFVNGKMVNGADFNKIQQLLEHKPS